LWHYTSERLFGGAGLFKGDQATAEQYQNLLDPLLKETRDG